MKHDAHRQQYLDASHDLSELKTIQLRQSKSEI